MIANLKIKLLERHQEYLRERERKLRKRKPPLLLEVIP